MDGAPLDWSQRLLYLGLLVAILLVIALFLCIIYGLVNRCCPGGGDDDDDDSNVDVSKPIQLPVGGAGKKANNYQPTGKSQLIGANKSPNQTTSIQDTDLLLATTNAAIPLRILAQGHEDMIIEVLQHMQVNDQENQINCLVCKDHKVSWTQTQTTVNIMVCKRDNSQEKRSPKQ